MALDPAERRALGKQGAELAGLLAYFAANIDTAPVLFTVMDARNLQGRTEAWLDAVVAEAIDNEWGVKD